MQSPTNSSPNAIAIVGMAGRFPGARDIEGFWKNLVAGVESISFFSEQELREAGVEPALLASPGFVGARSVLEGAELFDAAFFDLSPREAEVLDPQHRLLLECAWEALEHAGYDPRRYPGPVGVFAGTGFNTYLLSNVQHNPEILGAVGSFQAMLGNGCDTLATRVSYKLGLRGPSLTVQTACSTSLVAVHLAVQSLLNGECDMALAGGVRLLTPRKGGHVHQTGGIFSRDGHCRAFDAAATGATEGEGHGLVVLKRLADALADGDQVHAVILGTAINNDGSQKMGYTVPSIEGQSEVIAMAQALAGVDPGSIGMIEAHGTGTPLGDPIEVRALSRVFSTAQEPGLPCALGSLKTNLGHMDAAAGVGSLIKAALAVQRGVIPPSLHFERPNPQLDLSSTPFYVPVEATAWPGDGPRRAGVSSFGIGGTNAHVVLEEAPEVPAGGPARPLQLLVLSAPTLTALEKATENLAGHLRRHLDADLANIADIAYTLQVGRVAFDHRRVVVCASVEDAAEVLSSLDPKRVLTRTREDGERSVFFLFPGQGSQHPGMGIELYGSEAVFRDEVDRCADILRPLLGLDLRQVLYPEAGDPQEAAGRLQQTALAQPALFVIEYALARLWMSWGIQPQAMLGHSIGEYVAACLAGVFPLEDALRLVAERGRLMQEMPGGAMLAVPLSEAEVKPLLGELSLAAVNGPAMCVVSGEAGEIDDLAARLAERGVQARRLHTSHAFHSAAMEPMLERFEAAFQGIRPGNPRIPFLSNLTGTWIRPEEARSPRYWVRHLREAVRFSEGLETLFAQPSSVFLEVGPGQALTALARQHPKRPAAPAVVPSLPSAGDGRAADAAILRALGQLWMAGVGIDWSGVHSGERRLRVPLPTYPFERQRYWVEPTSRREQARRRIPHGAQELADWFWVPVWRQVLAPSARELPDGGWLVFADETGLGDRLSERLREQGAQVSVVRAGQRFRETRPDDFEIRPGAAADYGSLLDRLAEPGSLPARIVHLWSVGPAEEGELERSFFSLFHLARALGDRRPTGSQSPLHLGIVSTGVQRIAGDDDLRPVRATLLGPAATLPQEYPGITCAAIDVTLPSPASRRERRLVDLLLAELSAPGEPVVAYRGTDRWLPAFEPLRLESPLEPLPLRQGGTYLVTGGLGGVGLELAGLLARLAKARLVLSGRKPFPDRETWPELARGTGRTAEVARRLLDLEAAGAEVRVAAADVTDASSMARLFREVRDRFGRIDGVVHAAGLPGGGLLQWRSEEDAAAVLAPKVRGTLLLEEVLTGDTPDFLVLCSSLNALIGGPGQSDYTAANAFLDAFAQSRAGELPVLSVNWAAWRGVGMAALLPGADEVRDVEVTDLRPHAHPLLRERGIDGDGEPIFVGRLSASESWVIDEHRLGGSPIVPGTAYLEMADAAFRGLEGADGAVEIRDIQFIRPLRIADGETRELHAVLHRNGDGFHRFSIRSREDDGWQEHVLGSVGPAAAVEQERLDLSSLADWQEDVVGDDYREDLKQAGFGPRWEALRKVYRRDGEVVGLLELAPEFAADVEALRLHPALLDVATGFAQAYVEGRSGYYLPLSYKRLQVKGPLPARIYSHARLRDTGLQSLETLSFDIAVLDETGLERLRIEEYTIKRVDVAASLRETASHGTNRAAGKLAFQQVEETLGSMEPGQAVEAFRRILGSGGLPQIAISVQPLPEVIERARSLTADSLLKTVNLTSGGHARPDLATPYVEPRGELEERLAAIWRDVLGLDRVGTADDFFELGGHSLLGTQLISRVREAFGVEMPLGQLFESPTIADFAPVIAAKLDLAHTSGADTSGSGPSGRQAIPRLERGGELPLSFGQARLWFLHQWEPAGSGYNMSMALRGHGRFDVAVTAAVLNEIARRHEVLRTTFRVKAGEPEQIVSPHAAVPLPVIDLASLPAAARDLETERLAAEEARRPFDLGRGPLLRATVLRQAAEQHTVFLTVHHIVSDGWSTGVLVQEFGTLYAAFLAGRPSPLPELPIQYADFAAWQRRHLSGPFLETELSWWREQLAGMPPVLDLPTDHPRSADHANRAAVHEFEFGREDLAALTSLARGHGATLFMALLTGFGTLLARYTGQEDLAVGTPIAGRIHVETEPLIGLFVNSLVLRMRLAGDPDLGEILERTRETTLAAYAHQEMPFERLVDEAALERSLDRPPLVQVMLVLQNAPASALELPGVAVTASEMAVGTAKFELSCTLMETERGLHGVFEYSRNLFEAPTIARLAGHFVSLLRAAAATPRQRLSEARMLSEPELHQVLHEWNRDDEAALLDRWGAPVPIGVPGLSRSGDRARYRADGNIELLTDSGPEVQETDPAGATSHTEVEELLAGIWAEVLEVEGVGIRDNFFSLGGHSLLITQVLSRVRETFRVELAVRELFEAPTVGGFAFRIRQAMQSAARALLPPIEPIPRDGDLPLSFAQARLWFLDQLDPGSSAYNLPVALRVRGPIDVAAMEAALAETVRRHEALRTAFARIEGRPVQVIAEPAAVHLPQVDLRGLPEAEALRRLQEEGRRPFDLARGPLLRSLLIRLADEEHLLLLNMHHIVSDGWSMGILVREIGALYSALRAGQPSPLPELPVQYVDFAFWQRQWLQEAALEAELGYWREQLKGAPAALELPTDRSRPAVQTFAGKILPFALPRELSTRLQAMSRRAGATLFMTLLAVFQELLGRYSGQSDLTVGTPVAGRTHLQTEELIGFFVNMLVIRTDLSGGPSFSTLTGQLRETLLSAYAHQDLPFETLVEELQPERSLSRTPLYQVVLALQNTPSEALAAEELSFEPMVVDTGMAKFDLTVTVQQTDNGLAGIVEHNTDLFDDTTVLRLVRHWETLLAGVVGAPELRLADLPLLSPEERVQLLHEWSGKAEPYPREATIHSLFAEQAALAPDTPAVVGEGGSLSYGELQRQADRWARRLVALGVGPEVRVGVCLERSPARVVMTLAVLMAGGAYVPLDPANPRERLAFLVHDSGAAVLVTEERWLPVLEPSGAAVLCVDRDEPWEESLDAAPQVPAESLAYVMYTSGSTGEPKGVAVTHRAVVRLVRQTSYARFGPDEVFLQLAPYAFDASTLEIWGALLNGGRVVMPPAGVLSPSELGEILIRHGVTTLWLTAGLFHQMVDENLQSLAGIRQLLAGGDVLSVPHVRRVLAELPATRLINGYGPTENTTFTSCHPVTDPEALEPSVPLGRPIANTWVYVLDRNLDPVPAGVTGELCTGGDGLARGYFGRPDLTAERFVPDPFATEPGGRLYRTGDLARWRPSGELEFLGRVDTQVKVRGFRIEPGEIEAALTGHPWVRQAVVLVDGKGADKRLVACVAGAEGEAPESSELRGFLRDRLPEFMVPAAYVFLAEMPLTANGKVDRRALARLSPERVAATGGEGPRTPTEELLAGIFAEALRIEHIGVHDSFFELGGHSLLATQVISRVRQAFGVELPLRELFDSPTAAGLARAMEAARAAAGGPALVRVPRDGRLPLSFAQERLWFFDQLEPGSPAYNVPLAVSLKGTLAVDALERSLMAVAARHEALRTTFDTVDGSPVQVIADSMPVALPVVDLSGLPERERQEEARRRTAAEARRPFDLARGPLLRAALVRMAPDEHLALLTMHHIVSDAWSMEVLVRDLGESYRKALGGLPGDLPELAVQYADFSVWQRSWLRGEVLAQELGFWRRALERSPSVLDMPSDRPRPAVQTYLGAQESRALPGRLGAGLLALCRREGVTAFMTGLAVFETLVLRYTGQERFNVGTPIAGRNRLEIEPLIGFFVNTLVLPADLAGEPSFDEVLARVRDITLAAHAHQDVPFERLVEELEPERSLSHSPLFQVMFVLRNLPREPVALPDLELELLDTGTGTAKFDLVLSLLEDGRSLSAGYKTDLFDGSTLQRLLGHFETLLEGALEDPGRRISELPLLTGRERRQLLVEWNETGAAPPPERCVHELFEEQVERTPDAMAVVFEGRSLTYRELDGLANRLARFLRGRGVGPEVPVGIFLERSLEMVVALYGVLKAGGLYVALAPDFPRERLAFMFEEARVPVLLTRERLAGVLPEIDAEVVCLEVGEGLLSFGNKRGDKRGDERISRSGVTPANAAYMIYTSGSTGRPKGVVVEHRQLLCYVRNLEFLTGMGRGWSFASLQSPAVDSSKTVLFPALLSGGCVHMISEERAMDAQALGAYLSAERIDMLKIAPSHLATMMCAGEPERFLPRRLLIYGGEPSRREWSERLAEMAPDLPMFSNYGPTETTVGSSMYRVRAGQVHDVPMLPLGPPFPGTRYYLLDRNFQPVPVGVPGELYIGGPQVTRGYLKRPDLTAERYVPDLFSDRPGARMYRSGDVARHLPDGELESLGRIDHQVKIRGFRIELGDVESTLARHPAVGSCAVTAWEERPGERRLAAFVTGPGGEKPEPGELRSFLSESLPAYMVPSVFVVLDELPRTIHGKVDRLALRLDLVLPAGAGEEVSEDYVAPRNAAEQRLAALWSEVLGRERIGVHDNFFELGGHSLMATRLVSRIRDAFRIELPLRRLFESPTVAGLAEQMHGTAATEAPPLVSVPRDGAIPLSFAQERLWFLDQLVPESLVYNIPIAVRLTGRLSVPVLRASLDGIVRRHESLRTTFPLAADRPVQRIAPPAPLPLPVIDLAGLGGEASREAARLSDLEARRPFRLAQGPLLRVSLLRLAPQEHLALLTLHHIISDAWSTGVLIHELATLYESGSSGRPSPLPELPVQYADFSVWQRRRLAETGEEQLAYWRERLRSAPPELELPTDHPRPALPSSYGGLVTFPVPPAVASGLRRLGEREGATLFMVLMAGFDALLARYSGQTDLSVGTPVAGRNRSEIEPLIGFFVNTLVVRVDLSGEPAAREILARVKSASLEAFAHQDLPFERLVEALAPERNLGHTPLFQVLFSLQHTPRERLRLPELTLSPVPADTGTAKFDLVLVMEEDGEELRGVLSYSRDLFEAVTVTRMAGHLGLVLGAMAESPETALSRLPLLTEPERQAVTLEWNDTLRQGRGRECVHRSFEAWAARQPHALAVVSDGVSLSYGELDERANRLARLLAARGLRTEEVVGVCLERSAELLISYLAVLKAGGAYLPLDPNYPTERLRFMAENSGVRLLLTRESALERFAESTIEALLPDRLDWDSLPGGAIDGGVTPAHLAYVVYTSGSTGTPKGIEVTHEGLSNLASWHQVDYGVGPASRGSMIAGVSFDASFWEIWPYLIGGGSLWPVPARIASSIPDLLKFLAAGSITHAFMPTPLAELAMVEPDLRTLPLRYLIVGGDRLHRGLPQPANVELFNHYGPAEASIVTTVARVAVGEVDPAIGYPLPNMQVYVMDRDLQLLPAGVPGELLIGGMGLARGYRGRPDLTAERFLPDPLSGAMGGRLYRSGDLVRYRSDGQIDFLRRLGRQIKVRGIRIEPGEIETVLAQCPGVGQAVVQVKEKAGAQHLVAFVQPDTQTRDLDASVLRSFLRERLPEGMVPSAYLLLAELPLTPNGKVDGRALAALEWGGPDSQAYVAPRTPTEEIVAGFWAEMLGCGRVGVRDSFFELGGHSLMATRITSRVREAFGVEVPLRLLFETPTVEALAGQIDRQTRLAVDPAVSPAPPLARVSREGNLPLSFAQERFWFLDQLQPGNQVYNIPSALRLSGSLDRSALEQALAEVVRRHEALRTTFAAVDGVPVARIAPPQRWNLPFVDLGGLPVEIARAEGERLAGEAARRPFDLTRGPLLRASLLLLREQEHVLLMTLHHIISDGWSMGILFHELAVLYEARVQGRQGRPSPLPELPVQYADYSAWQREWLRGEVLVAELAYWRRRLEPASIILELPTDHPRPAVMGIWGARERFSLPADLSKAIHRFGHSQGATLFMTLLAAFQTLLFRYTGQGSIRVGTPIAGRSRVEVEPLIGLFLNTLVLRGDPAGDLAFDELLAAARETCFEAYAHQDVPFEKLVHEISPERSLSHTPLFQVMLVLQNAPAGAVDLPQLRLEPVAADTGTTKMDLTLSLDAEATAGTLSYKADLFESVTIRRLLGHFRTLLEGIVEDPRRRLSDLPLLGAVERWQLLAEWNDTVAAPPPERYVHELFEEQVERTPDALAVVFEGQGLTYRQLDRRANQVAHLLREHGVGPEVAVGIYLERTVEMMVALLGVLKSGGVYLSLATNFPRERLVTLFEEAQVPLVLTRRSLAANVAGTTAGIVCLDQDEAALAGYPESRPDSGVTRVNPGNAAYMIYTSGSTGAPKRVVVEHRQIVLYCRNLAEQVGLQPGWSFAAAQSPAVDASKTTLYPALLTGGCLHMISEDRAADAEALGDYMVEHRIDVLKLAPSHLETLMSAGGPERLMPRRLLIYGGEGAPRNWADRLARMAPDLTMFSNYGPTETTVGSSMYRVRAGRLHDVSLVPLGRPFPHTRYYLLDQDLQPVPAGAAGELFIAGLQVSRGYQRQPHLTAERFLPDPFSGEPGARMYRTGDLARRLHDGELETLGRTDHQVKIRGFRVELGEIEALLAGHPAVATCAVIAREDRSGEKRLVAFVTARAGEEPPAAELRSFLRERLPEHMVPAAFLFLDELPRNALHGKLDRRALVVPGGPAGIDTPVGESYTAPRNAVERRMAEIWSEVLGRERIGVHDNFFDLGGHSLLAVRLISRIRRELGRALPVSALFQGATVEHLAALLTEQGASRRSALVELQAGNGRPPFFCVHPIGGNVFCYVELARRLGEEQPFYGLQRPDLQVELGSIEAMAAHYLDALRAVQPEGPYRLGGWSLGGAVAFEMARQLRESGESVDSLVLIDSFAPGSDVRPEAMDEAALLSRFAGDLARLAGHDPGNLADLGAAPTLESLFEVARKRGLAIPDLDLVDLKTLFEMFRQGSAAIRAYEPRPYPGRLTLLRASASRARGDHGWERLAAEVRAEDIPGDHYGILRSPGVEVLAERLRRLLE